MSDFEKAIVRILNGTFILAVAVAVVWTLLQVSEEMRANRLEGAGKAYLDEMRRELKLERLDKALREDEERLRDFARSQYGY